MLPCRTGSCRPHCCVILPPFKHSKGVRYLGLVMSKDIDTYMASQAIQALVAAAYVNTSFRCRL